MDCPDPSRGTQRGESEEVKVVAFLTCQRSEEKRFKHVVHDDRGIVQVGPDGIHCLWDPRQWNRDQTRCQCAPKAGKKVGAISGKDDDGAPRSNPRCCKPAGHVQRVFEQRVVGLGPLSPVAVDMDDDLIR